MVKILHTGDLHMDSAFVGLSREASAARRRGQRELLRDIVELGNQEGAQLLLLSGDLLDGENAYYETARSLCEILARSTARVFIAPGNHDPYHSASPYRSVRFPENVHLFTTSEIQSVDIPELGVCVHGAAFLSQIEERELLSGFRAPEDDRIHIMVLHGEVTQGFSRYNPIRETQIAESGLSYLALGHIHAGDTTPRRAGNTVYAYCGCPEGRGFDELGAKGVLIGEVSKDSVSIRFQETGRYRYHITELALSEEDDPITAAQNALPAQDAFSYHRLIFTGEHEQIPADAMRVQLENRVAALSILDRTTSPRSIWEGENDDTLKGAFLRNLHRAYNQSQTEEEQKKIRLAARFGVAALENREEPQ